MCICVCLWWGQEGTIEINPHSEPGDKNSTHPLVIMSEIWKGRVILPKALVLLDECFGKNYSRKSYYILLGMLLKDKHMCLQDE